MSALAFDTALQAVGLSPRMRRLIITGEWERSYRSRYRAWCAALYALGKERVPEMHAWTLMHRSPLNAVLHINDPAMENVDPTKSEEFFVTHYRRFLEQIDARGIQPSVTGVAPDILLALDRLNQYEPNRWGKDALSTMAVARAVL